MDAYNRGNAQLDLFGRYIRKLPLHCALPKTAKLCASKVGRDISKECVWESQFRVLLYTDTRISETD